MWLKAPVKEEDRDGKQRNIGGGKSNRKGTPQGNKCKALHLAPYAKLKPGKSTISTDLHSLFRYHFKLDSQLRRLAF